MQKKVIDMKQTVSSPRRLELPRNAAEWLEAIMNFLFFLCGILAVGCVVPITVHISIRIAKHINSKLLSLNEFLNKAFVIERSFLCLIKCIL